MDFSKMSDKTRLEMRQINMDETDKMNLISLKWSLTLHKSVL